MPCGLAGLSPKYRKTDVAHSEDWYQNLFPFTGKRDIDVFVICNPYCQHKPAEDYEVPFYMAQEQS